MLGVFELFMIYKRFFFVVTCSVMSTKQTINVIYQHSYNGIFQVQYSDKSQNSHSNQHRHLINDTLDNHTIQNRIRKSTESTLYISFDISADGQRKFRYSPGKFHISEIQFTNVNYQLFSFLLCVHATKRRDRGEIKSHHKYHAELTFILAMRILLMLAAKRRFEPEVAKRGPRIFLPRDTRKQSPLKLRFLFLIASLRKAGENMNEISYMIL